MLKELRIENFAIIEELEILFAPNLNIFTGETGAGKSIIIDAVEALLGGRVDSSMIRAGEDRANLEGVFEIPPQNKTAIHEILQREELLDDSELVLLGREIRSTGRNIARVNGRTTSTNLLRELGEYLVDVHGQSEHLSLLRVKQHQSLLDNFAHAIQAVDPKSNQAIETLIADYAAHYQEFHALQRELELLQTAEQDAARRADLLTYQINEIESARLRPNEEAELQEERNRLANAEGLASLTQQALQARDESNPETPAASDLIGQVETALINLARLDPSQEELAAQAQALVEDLAEIASALRAYQDTIEFNPRRLDQVEERLDLIHNL
jgi:DNA repair protein RecN (Recombination protein N)